jgi:hypothetical protein
VSRTPPILETKLHYDTQVMAPVTGCDINVCWYSCVTVLRDVLHKLVQGIHPPNSARLGGPAHFSELTVGASRDRKRLSSFYDFPLTAGAGLLPNTLVGTHLTMLSLRVPTCLGLLLKRSVSYDRRIFVRKLAQYLTIWRSSGGLTTVMRPDCELPCH